MYRRLAVAALLALVIAMSLVPVVGVPKAIAQVRFVIPSNALTVILTPSNFTSAFVVSNGVAYAAVGNESSYTPVVLEFTPGTYNLGALNAQKIVLNASAVNVVIELDKGAVIEGNGVEIAPGSSNQLLVIMGGEGSLITDAVIDVYFDIIQGVELTNTIIKILPNAVGSVLTLDTVYGQFKIDVQPCDKVGILINNSITNAEIYFEPTTSPESISIMVLNSTLSLVDATKAVANATTSGIIVKDSEIRVLSYRDITQATINSSTIKELYIYSGGATLYNDFVDMMVVENSNVTLAFSTVNMLKAVNSTVTTYASMIKMVSKTNCQCIEKQVIAKEICVEFGMHHWCVSGNMTLPPVIHPIFRVINATHARLCINATLCIDVPIYALNMSKMLLNTELGNQSMVVPVMCKMMKHLRGYILANSNITSVVEKIINATHAILNMTLETPGNVSLVLPANFTVRAVYKNGTLWHNYTVTVSGNATIVDIGDPTTLEVVLLNTSAVTNTTTPTNTTTTSTTTPMISTETAAVIVGVLAVAVIGATILALRRRSTIARY